VVLSVGSLFSGIGGLERGLEMCGLGPVMWQCEIDPCARAVLAEHWPDVRRYDDVREIDASVARTDVVAGGFSCQPHSVAGRRRGTSDARWIWPEFARIINVVRPRYVFIENVPGLRSSGLRDVLAVGALLREGGVQPSAYGVAARMDRLRLLGNACVPQQAALAWRTLSERVLAPVGALLREGGVQPSLASPQGEPGEPGNADKGNVSLQDDQGRAGSSPLR
jgi:site-specific DNA-cytosine methylase